MNKMIEKEVVVPASLQDVWHAWTTSEGATAFFAPEAKIKLAIGGTYELYFSPENPPGSRGSENCKVLSYFPERMLSFNWNAPPELPDARKERTWVVMQFEPARGRTTKVKLTHLGWEEGGRWDRAYQYFQTTWDVVLYRLQQRFKAGPIDWKNPPRPPAKWSA